MTDILDEIKDIVNEYMLQGKIAVFVGAGVSKLSDYPSWTELILGMAKRIGYTISLRDQSGNECLSSDEYLKIPQIFYDDKGETEYIKSVRKQLHTIKEPNEIHKIIMRLKPNHILTTNYDTLIEQAANRAGMAYSVINSDQKVATAPTRNYIVKVHGDFETNNFVLKEKDYLDYETNFKLIDNLMKTIISTHLVIFVGYSLGDYNIKLILNWVRQVQKDSFIEPIFIHTDSKALTDTELVYYQKEHLKVIDANTLVEDSKNTSYLERYTKALNALLDPARSEKWFRNETWIVNHFYNIIAPLKDVNYLRTVDIAPIFSESKILYINQLQSEECKYLIEAYAKRQKLSQKRAIQLEDIILRIRNSGIENIQSIKIQADKELLKKIQRGMIIDNNTFDVSYQNVRKRIDYYGDDIVDQYNKAYDLYWIGRLDDAMELYYKLLADCYTRKRWILYFFTQINLFYLRQTVIIMNGQLASLKGAVILGKPLQFWDDEEIHDMQLSHIITDIPAEIKKYTFLQKLTEKNYYKDDFVRLCQDNFDIEKNITKEMYTSAGQSKDQAAKIRTFDAINFIYGNKITFDRFNEHRSYTKIALHQRIKGMLSQKELAAKSPWGNMDKNGYIGFQEVLLMIRCFNYDDLEVFFDKDCGNEILLENGAQQQFDKYVRDLLSYFIDHFSGVLEGAAVIEYITLKDEVKNALFLSSYYSKENETIIEIAQYLFRYAPSNELLIHKRLDIFGRLSEKSADKVMMRELLENDIIERLKRCNDGNDNVIAFERNDIAFEVNALKEWFPGYISLQIGNLMKSSREIVVQEIKPIFNGII